MRVPYVCLVAMCAACGGGGGGGDDGPAPDGPVFADADPNNPLLSDDYPGDVGLGGDPAVVWFEDFEAASVGAVAGRYDQVQGQGGMALVTDRPSGQGGANAMAMTANTGQAVDLYKMLPNHDELWVRWYAKYEAGVVWHHSGTWFGGYNPPIPYPNPGAGTRPAGDDRVSFSIEPVFGGAGMPRFDFYNYWRGMHSYNAGTVFWGNALIHQNSFTVDPGQWVCLEVHARLNPNGGSAAGAVLDVWKNETLVVHFDDAGPLGYWIADKFCPTGADGRECTDYPAPATEVLDLQFRTTTALALNAFWPQNYDPDQTATLTFDQMVVATTRIGCLR